jgi:heat shock protein HslJ
MLRNGRDGMRRFLFVGLMVMSALALVGCSSGSLVGKTWDLSAITTQAPAFQGVVPATDRPNYTLTFNSDGTFAAKADCNQVGGTYKTNGSNGLTMTPGPSTLAACPEGSYGNQYVQALAKAASYGFANNQLTITLSDGGTLVFD